MVQNLVQPIKSNFITYFNTAPPGSIRFIMTVRLSLPWDNSAPIGRIFMKFDMFFLTHFEQIQVSLKSDNNNGYLT